jgi:hypothetical protein
MITESDNNAATALWDEDGMNNLAYFLHAAGMNETQLNPAWGLTQITAQDETILLRNILLRPNAILSAHAQGLGSRTAGLGLDGTAGGGELPVVGVVAGAFGLELVGGTHDLGAEGAQLPGDGLVG